MAWPTPPRRAIRLDETVTDRQRIALVLVFAVAVVGGGLLALNLLGGSGAPGPGEGPSSSAIGQVSPSAGAPGSALVPPSSGSASPLAPPSPSAAGSPGESPIGPTSSPTTQPELGATITFRGLKLDAQQDPEGKRRIITFRSLGAGDITVFVTARSPQGSVRMCLSTPDKTLGCKNTASGSLHASTTKPAEDFTVTLRGLDIATPVVDVAITFPSTAPAVTIDNARFDGTDNAAYNGIEALLTPRSEGDVRLQAEWGGHPFLYEGKLVEQGGPGSVPITGSEAATGVDTSIPVTAGHPWLLTLSNAETGFGPTRLTATIAWP